MKKFNVREAAAFLGVCVQRIHAKIRQGHFPGAHNCECGKSYLIPETDVKRQPKRISTNVKTTNGTRRSKLANEQWSRR